MFFIPADHVPDLWIPAGKAVGSWFVYSVVLRQNREGVDLVSIPWRPDKGSVEECLRVVNRHRYGRRIACGPAILVAQKTF